MAKTNRQQQQQPQPYYQPTQSQSQVQIPRPLNCFLMYRLEKQKEIVAKCPTANHRDISKIIAKWWQDASEEEKKPFRERARIAKEAHNRMYPDYKYTPKKKVTPKRIYIRRNKKEQFTSRAKENNMLMEMIYDDPSALKHLTMDEKSAATATAAAAPATKQSAPSIGCPSPQSTWSPVHVTVEGEDICYRSPCLNSPPLSVASSYSSASTPFDSPHVSPYSEYSEFDNSTCDNTLYYPSALTTTFSSYSKSQSPFGVLDSPFIDNSNAYPNSAEYNMGMIDYLHFDHSNASNTYKPTQEFSWTEDCDANVYGQDALYHLMKQVVHPPVEYIDPALLQNN